VRPVALRTHHLALVKFVLLHARVARREIRKRPELGRARIRQDPCRLTRGGGAKEPECRLARAMEGGGSRERHAALDFV